MASVMEKFKGLVGLKQGIGEIRAGYAGICTELKECEARKLFLEKALVPRSDVYERMTADIDRRGEEFAERFEMQCAFFSKRHANWEGLGGGNNRLFADTRNGGADVRRTNQLHDLMCHTMGDELKAAVAGLLDQRDWSNCGPPEAEREAEIKQLEKRIAQLQQEEETITTEARALGMTL